MSGTISDLLQHGIAAAKAQRVDEARRTLMRVVELDEHNEQAWLWLSGVVESPDDRRVCLENVLTINPDNTLAQSGLRWLNEHAPARDRCPHCQAPLPTSGDTCPACQQPLLVVCPHCDEYAEITDSFCPHCHRALGNFRAGARYYLDLAHAYLDRDRRPLVVWALDQAEATKPRDPDVLGRLAELNMRLERAVKAIALYRQAMTLAPDCAADYIGLGAVYRQQAMHHEARAVYQQAFKYAPNDPALLVGLAQAILDDGGPAREAIDHLERAAQVQPDDAAVHALLGKLYRDQGDAPLALQRYSRAAELTEPTSLLGGEVRREVVKLQAALPRPHEGRGELIRQAGGPVLISIMAALANAKLSPLHISLVSWLALGLSLIGAWLWANADHVRRKTAHPRRESAVGLIVWLIGFSLIVARG
jgi:tetratricopeptide (TPR) repeat protein